LCCVHGKISFEEIEYSDYTLRTAYNLVSGEFRILIEGELRRPPVMAPLKYCQNSILMK
jgi:hypothetical protein